MNSAKKHGAIGCITENTPSTKHTSENATKEYVATPSQSIRRSEKQPKNICSMTSRRKWSEVESRDTTKTCRMFPAGQSENMSEARMAGKSKPIATNYATRGGARGKSDSISQTSA
jgi:hypothetical protein